MIQLFRKILCPIDFDRVSTAALHVARKLAEQNDAAVYLLYAAAPPLPGPLERFPEWEKTAKARLEEIARQRFEGKVRTEVVVRRGDPAAAVIKAVEELGAEVVVMATHGRKGVGHLLLGSVAERVVRESPVPVLTVRPS